MTIKISVATLTYGERKQFLYQTVDQLLTQNFEQIYIYCNGISLPYFRKITKKYHQDNVKILYSKINRGSAGGYHELVKYASTQDPMQYLLLLDDDNLISTDFSDKVIPLLEGCDSIIFINRANRRVLVEARDSKRPCLELGTKNSFLGRDIFKQFLPSYEQSDSDLIAAPYSGLILPPTVLQKRILPNKAYFLYADDHEYTYRLVTAHNYKISLITDLAITDLEDSFHLDKRNQGFLSNRYIEAEKLRVFYSVRNQFFFGLNRCDNKWLFTINVTLVSAYITLGFILRGKFKQIGWFFSAIKNGFNIEGNS